MDKEVCRANKDFMDVLCNFLTMPLVTINRLVQSNKEIFTMFMLHLCSHHIYYYVSHHIYVSLCFTPFMLNAHANKNGHIYSMNINVG